MSGSGVHGTADIDSVEPSRARAHVVVVGAGLSGLVAARELTKKGVDVTVLDARDRVGGRLKPLEYGHGLDAGGEFSSLAQVELQSLAAEFGIEWRALKEHPGAMVISYGGERRVEECPFASDPETGAEVLRASELIDGYARRLNVANPASTDEARMLDALTVREWAEQNLASALSRAWLEKEAAPDGSADRISMLSFVWLVARHGGWEGLETLAAGHFVGGAAQIPLRLAEELQGGIRLSTAVTAVSQTPTGVTVETDRGAFDADAVILATGGNTTGVSFDPALPEGHRVLAESWIPLQGAKFFAEYDRPFWVELGLNGVALGGDYLHPALDAGLTDDQSIICGMIFAPDTTDEAFSEDERKARIIADLVRLYGPDAAQPKSVVVENWGIDPWSAGPGNALPTGALTAAGDAVTQPFGRIAWAGADRGPSDYMEGAIGAGKRAAQQVQEIIASSAIGALNA